MKTKHFAMILLWALSLPCWAGGLPEFSFGRFGQVRLFVPGGRPQEIIIFVSGEEGWVTQDADIARELTGREYAVIGVDARTYLAALDRSPEPCLDIAADFKELSQFAQKKIAGHGDIPPLLAGLSLGGTLVYAALAQAPPETFRGGVSLGFRTDLALVKPLCRGQGLQTRTGPKGRGIAVLPCPALNSPWIALQGTLDRICTLDSVTTFVSLTGSAQLIELGGMGHDFSRLKDWMARFQMALRIFSDIKPAQRPDVVDRLEDLPLATIPVQGSSSPLLTVDVTGDGGYGVTDQGICESLSRAGIPAVSLNSLKYFWTKKTPDIAAADLARILRHFLKAWKKERIVLVGYSLGAEVLPFMINRLPEDLKNRITTVALLGPSATTNFEFHLMDWLVTKSRADDLPVIPEIERLENVVLFCFYGVDDSLNICHKISMPNLKVIALNSKHRLGRNYLPVVEAILKEVGSTGSR